MRLSAVLLGLCLACASSAFAQVSSVQSGPWSSPATWGGRLPSASDVTMITAGHVVTFDTMATVAELDINGILRISRAQSSSLTVNGNVLVYGVLDMGTAADPIPPRVTHDLIFHLTQAQARAYVGGPLFQPTDYGLWNFGRWDAHGAPLLRTWGKLAVDVPAGSTTVAVEGFVGDWPIGGQIVLTTTAAPTTNDTDESMQVDEHAEYATIAAATGSVLTVSTPLQHAHQGSPVVHPLAGTVRLAGAVGLLTHNVTIRTDLEGLTDITDVRQRLFAHAIVFPNTDGTTIGTGGGTGNLENIAFVRMGHYGTIGRYALHYHRLGESSRGLVLRGVSFVECGFRCTNTHESNGILIEDTVCLQPGGGAAHFPETDAGHLGPRSTFGDYALSHNLVIEGMGKHRADGGTDAIAGETQQRAAAFWVGATRHEQIMGNVAAGGNVSHTGVFWQGGAAESSAGQHERVYLNNEAHGNQETGFFGWQNRPLASGHDAVGTIAWHNNREGFVHGAYGSAIFSYRSLIVGSQHGYVESSNTTILQDAIVLGRGTGASRYNQADIGITIEGFNFAPVLWRPARYTRVLVGDLTPARNGAEGIGLTLPQISCPAGALSCHNPHVLRFSQVVFGPNLRPLRFGPERNADSFWMEPGRVLIRPQSPLGSIAALFVTPATTYDLAADALSTPVTALPSMLAWTIPDGNGNPLRITMPLVEPAPPSVDATTSLFGSIATITAVASPDTTRVEFWDGPIRLCDLSAPPWTCTADLSNLAALGDNLAPRHFHYVYARAFNGVWINAVPAPSSGGPEAITRLDQLADATDVPSPGYALRAYSTVLELGPDAFGAVTPPPPPPPPDDPLERLRQQVAQLQADLVMALADRDSARAQLVSLQAQIAILQAAIMQAIADRATAEIQVTTLQQQLATLRAAVQAAIALLSVVQ